MVVLQGKRGIGPLVYLLLISSFKSSASSSPSFTSAAAGAEAMGFARGGLFSIKASCKPGATVLNFEEPIGRGAPRLDVPPVWIVMVGVDEGSLDCLAGFGSLPLSVYDAS